VRLSNKNNFDLVQSRLEPRPFVCSSQLLPENAVDVASDPALVSFEECNRSQSWRFLRRRRKFPPIVAVLLRAATVSGDSLTKTAHAQADILFKPPLENVDLLDWQAFDQAIESGYRHTVDKLERVGKPLARCTRGVTTGVAL
jgi:NTE family protein